MFEFFFRQTFGRLVVCLHKGAGNGWRLPQVKFYSEPPSIHSLCIKCSVELYHLNYFVTATEINSPGDIVLTTAKKSITVWDELACTIEQGCVGGLT
jgi:hypothetical protein